MRRQREMETAAFTVALTGATDYSRRAYILNAIQTSTGESTVVSRQ